MREMKTTIDKYEKLLSQIPQLHSTYDVAGLILLKMWNIDNIILDFYLLIGQMILQVSFEKPYNEFYFQELAIN